MNRDNLLGRESLRMHRRFRSRRGHSMVEMAAVMPVMALLLLGATDMGRLFYASVAVSNAARAGAQYGCQSLVTAADPTGMTTAAKNDGSNISSLSVSASQCTCMTSATVPSCASSYCTDNPQATFVEVDTGTTFKTLMTYPGVPSSIPLSGKAIMRVEQ